MLKIQTSGTKYDVIIIVLAIQNMKNLTAVADNLKRFIKDDGKVVIVLNHPAFCVPQHSGWELILIKVQYRHVDAYV